MSTDVPSSPEPESQPPAPPPAPSAPASPPAAASGGDGPPQEIKIISHSMMFYWWPVWAVGLLMGILTMINGELMALVPKDSRAERGKQLIVGQDPETKALKPGPYQDMIVVPEGEKLVPANEQQPKQPKLKTADTPSYAVVFLIVLLLVIVITNVPLRGLWSVVVIIVIVLMSVIFALAGWWEKIIGVLFLLDIRMNMAGYFFIALVLLGIWCVTTFFFDRQVYMTFVPGQFKVHMEIGGGESSYDTIGMVIHKQRDDLFRHWILGLGSGDLVVRTSGANAHEFSLHNVLFIGRKLDIIMQMQRDMPVVRG